MQLTAAERFQTALFLSATLHAIVLLGLQFRAPPRDSKPLSSLNVVLVNSKSQTRPDEAQALAQANLDGGGNTDENRLAKSPLPVGDAEFKDGASPPPQPSAKAARKSERQLSKPRAPATRPAPTEAPPVQREALAQTEPAAAAPTQPQASVPAEPVPPELQAIAQQETQARERVAQLEREARELMTQLKSERSIEQPGATFTVPPDYQPRPSPPSTPAQSAVRVVKVEPQNTAAQPRPSIQAPPQEARPQREPQQQPLPQVAANTGLKPTPRAPEPSPPEPEAKRPPTHAPAPAPVRTPAPPPTVEVKEAPRAEPVPPQPAPTPEVKIVKLESKPSTPEPPQLPAQAQAQAPTTPTPEPRQEPPANEPPKPQLPSAAELMRRSSEIARLEAQIAKNYDEYQKRPRRKFIGARTAEFRFAQYIEEWRTKVERVGNTNYPEAAKQRRIYGSLQLTVAIKSDGAVESVEINRSSGQKVLDAAAIRIVELAGPYSQFPADISKDTDILHITRTWTFTRADQLVSE